MSLSRLALRLAAYEALNPYAATPSGPWPTVAGPNVYDSRLDPIAEDEELAAIEAKPILNVYTEEDIAQPYGSARFPPEEQVVDLVVEAAIAAKGTLVIEQADGTTMTIGAISAPISSRQHEAILDVLEAQVRRLFDKRFLAATPSAELFAKVAMELHHVRSVPQRAADRVTRLAARTICFKVKVKTERWPTAPFYDDDLVFAEGRFRPDADFAALLPEPLATIARLLDPASTGYVLCQQVAGLLAPPPPPSPLAEIDIFSGLGLRRPLMSDGADADVRTGVVTGFAPPAGDAVVADDAGSPVDDEASDPVTDDS